MKKYFVLATLCFNGQIKSAGHSKEFSAFLEKFYVATHDQYQEFKKEVEKEDDFDFSRSSIGSLYFLGLSPNEILKAAALGRFSSFEKASLAQRLLALNLFFHIRHVPDGSHYRELIVNSLKGQPLLIGASINDVIKEWQRSLDVILNWFLIIHKSKAQEKLLKADQEWLLKAPLLGYVLFHEKVPESEPKNYLHKDELALTRDLEKQIEAVELFLAKEVEKRADLGAD